MGLHLKKKQLLLWCIIVFCSLGKMSMGSKLKTVDFEVYGKVQGVFFRKFTEKQGKALGVRGWCMNTEKGTVQGCLQGEEEAVKSMKQWLKQIGSPSSKIDRCEFTNEKSIRDYSFNEFKIRR